MGIYQTVFRVEYFFENKGGKCDWVFLYAIGWREEPFVHPATPFLEATNKETLELAHPDWVLRFLGYADIYAKDVESLKIQNLTFSPFASGDVETVCKNLMEGLNP